MESEWVCFSMKMALQNVLLEQITYTYFKKGCFSDACFIDRSASCSLNLWLFSLPVGPKARENVYFLMIWFSPGMHMARKAINTFIYSKHEALRSMKQGSCIMHH